ncbi:MAG: hypothetical protein N2112_15845 [Gemmataceae bacterium]|nr:hypothetical protein [Gemmataceae bacterium]
MITNPDPYGYRLDLQDALATSKAAKIVYAYARCLIHGSSLDSDLKAQAEGHIPNALPQIKAELKKWIEAARLLGERWDDADEIEEADHLLEGMIELRTDAEGLEKAIGEPIRELVNQFDRELLVHKELLETLVGTNWYTNYCESIPVEISQPLWWLNLTDEPKPVGELFDAEFKDMVARVQYARKMFPSVVGMLAADVSDEADFQVRKLVWRSPDQLGEARFNLPPKTTAEEEKALRPVQIFFDKKPKAHVLVQLGPYQEQTDERGRIWVTLEKLRPTWNGRLYVGTPQVEWILERDS